MRRSLVILLAALVALSLGVAPLLAGDHDSHACKKAEKSCCTEKADCCKTADAKCCKDAKACCDDTACCKTAADGTHTCAMKHADGSACKHCA